MISNKTLRLLADVSWHADHGFTGFTGTAWGIASGAEADDKLSRSAHAVQIHGRLVIPAGAVANPDRPEADGIFTTTPGQMVAVKTADCLPVLFSSKGEAPFAMAIHAGWRGFCAGILREGIKQARTRGIEPGSMRVMVGPAICSRHFEIGPEVVDALLAHSGEALAATFLSKGKADRWHADLQTAAVLDLLDAGFHTRDIHVVRVCTFESDFPSYRRDGKGCGRLVSWITCPGEEPPQG